MDLSQERICEWPTNLAISSTSKQGTSPLEQQIFVISWSAVQKFTFTSPWGSESTILQCS
jgi:hypothetical protein